MPGVQGGALRCLLESAPDGFFVHDVNGQIIDVNAAMCRDLGYSREELRKMSVRDFASIGEAESNRRLWTEAVPGMALTIDRFAVRKDGSTYPVEISLTCQLIEGEKLFLGFARNVTEREAARLAPEQAVDELEAQVAARTAS